MHLQFDQDFHQHRYTLRNLQDNPCSNSLGDIAVMIAAVSVAPQHGAKRILRLLAFAARLFEIEAPPIHITENNCKHLTPEESSMRRESCVGTNDVSSGPVFIEIMLWIVASSCVGRCNILGFIQRCSAPQQRLLHQGSNPLTW